MGAAMKKESSELETVRYLLRQWVRWNKRWFPDLGVPHAVPYIDGMRGQRPMDGYDDPEGDDARIYAWEMMQVEQAVRSQLTSAQRIAIRVIYMREEGSAVYHSNRVPTAHCKALCLEAEVALIPALRRREVRL